MQYNLSFLISLLLITVVVWTYVMIKYSYYINKRRITNNEKFIKYTKLTIKKTLKTFIIIFIFVIFYNLLNNIL